jgi:hypothetical protein
MITPVIKFDSAMLYINNRELQLTDISATDEGMLCL